MAQLSAEGGAPLNPSSIPDALDRLCAEGFLSVSPQGFCCMPHLRQEAFRFVLGAGHLRQWAPSLLPCFNAFDRPGTVPAAGSLSFRNAVAFLRLAYCSGLEEGGSADVLASGII